MKNFIILLLLGVVIVENVYIYRNPETVCSDLQAKMEKLKSKAKKKGAEWVKDVLDEEIDEAVAE